MDVLVLGGTAFLGHAVAEQATGRGHAVTCAARGSAPAPAGAAFVRLDRDDEQGLEALAGSTWDLVVDVSRHPGQVRRAVRDLRARHWVFISSANAYTGFDHLEQAEDAPVHEPLVGDVLEDMESYGPAKVACEQAVRATEGTATIVRSGLIAGPGDLSGRVGYYPWRFAHPTGADVLVPDDPAFPCALIDVEDLAAWIVLAGEDRVDGTFNATGPTTLLGEVLAASRTVAGSAADAAPVPLEVLAREGVGHWMGPRSLPLWIPDVDWRFFATLDTRAARAAGLSTRPLAETLARALAFEEGRTVPRQAGLSDEEERELRSALG